MNNNSGKGIRSRYFKTFWVMLLTFTLVIPCLNGIRIQVHAADTAEVWKIYGQMSEETATYTAIVPDSESIAGQEPIGKFITGGDYTLKPEDADKLIIADNAEITAGSVNARLIKMSGNSNFIYSNYTLSSTESRFSSYPVSSSAITVNGLQAHYEAEGTPYFMDSRREIWRQSYDLTVNGDMTIAGFPDKDEDDNDIIVPNWIGYNDTLITPTGHISIEEGGHLLVEHSLTVESGGTLIGSGDDHYLRICLDAIITGLPLYAGSNDVSDRFDGDLHDQYEFRYNSVTSKWIYPFDLDAPIFRFSIGGFDKDHESIAVQYKYSAGESYTAVTPVMTGYEGDTANYGISLNNCPDNATSVYLKIDFTPANGSNKIFACWSTMADEYNFSYEGISNNMLTLEKVFNIDDVVNISLNYPNAGMPEIINKANDYLYAYAGADEATIKTYLATELYNRFIEVAMYEDFWIKRKEGFTARINELASRITVTGSLGSINASSKDGTVTIPVYNYKVSWGNNINNGNPVESNIPVYILPHQNNFLICTDFNQNTGTGNTFYIRKAAADELSFDVDDSQNDGDCAIPLTVTSLDPGRVVIGGMGADTTVLNSDNVYALDLSTRWLEGTTNPANYRTKIRIIIESETYVMLTGDGEEKNYGHVGNNGFGTDSIWNTRSDDTAEAMVYIGYTNLYLRPLTEQTGVTLREITGVELADESLSAGVHIDDYDKGNIHITFESNFYATIPLNITYSGGITKKLTINRVGLVIQYMYLSGSPTEDRDVADCFEMEFGHRSEKIPVNYDYFAGEQIIVYGIYYTPSNDPTGGSSDLSLYLTFENGTHRVVSAVNEDTLTLAGENNTVSRGFNGKLPATNDSVATTVFLIGFAQAKNWAGAAGGNIWIDNVTDTYYSDEGRIGFYANVLNDGWDDDDNFGGTQVGSGRGIHWDGHITWY